MQSFSYLGLVHILPGTDKQLHYNLSASRDSSLQVADSHARLGRSWEIVL